MSWFDDVKGWFSGDFKEFFTGTKENKEKYKDRVYPVFSSADPKKVKERPRTTNNN